jgi:Xaa-Pro aminopeptidase
VIEALATERLARLRSVMADVGVPALLTSDPLHIRYATGVSNMTVFGMMGPSRFVVVFADGPIVLYEYPGCEHLAATMPTVDEVRAAPGITAHAGAGYVEHAARFAAEIAADVRRHVDAEGPLAVERLDFVVTDALRDLGLRLVDATAVVLAARRIKVDSEVAAMREAVTRVEAGVAVMEAAASVGRTEVEVWAELHRHLIANEGEYITTRLLQSGARTFPYFQEAGARRLEPGDLLCLDTDAAGVYGCAVDFSRTFVVGGERAAPQHRALYAMALDQLRHNAALLAPGRSYEEFARRAWPVPARVAPYGYYCLAHGLGLSGEHPVVPLAVDGQPYELAGEFEPGMVMCVESYIGDPDTGAGVKLEDQYLVIDRGAERMTSYPFSAALGA